MRDVLREDHEAFRAQVRRFVEREIAPHHLAWEDAGRVPLSLWQAAGQAGLLNTTLPDPYGGGGDFGHAAVVIEELGAEMKTLAETMDRAIKAAKIKLDN